MTSKELIENNKELKALLDKFLDGFEDNIKGLFILLETQKNCDTLLNFIKKHKDIIDDTVIWQKAISISDTK